VRRVGDEQLPVLRAFGRRRQDPTVGLDEHTGRRQATDPERSRNLPPDHVGDQHLGTATGPLPHADQEPAVVPEHDVIAADRVVAAEQELVRRGIGAQPV
jgi:hypothetical protein